MFSSVQQIWNDAVARNRAALALVVAEILALLDIYGGMGAVRVPRTVHAAIMRALRPAESALRRLIVIAARDVKAEPDRPRTKPKQARGRASLRKPASRMFFQLFDPRKRFSAPRVNYTTLTPRISFIAPRAPFAPLFAQPGVQDRGPAASPSDHHISARRLALRLKALSAALDDIQHQAKRLARLRLKRSTQNPPKHFSPLRPGKPPGYRSKPLSDVDEILANCHTYALGVLSEAAANTS